MISNTSKSLLVHPDKNPQSYIYHEPIKLEEEETASVYLLSAESELQTEKINNSEKSILAQQSKQNEISKKNNESKPSEISKTQISKNANNSYINKNNQQANTNQDIYAKDEEDTASVYLLSTNSELQTEKVNNSEKSKQNEISKPNIKSKQTENPNPQTQISNKTTNNSYINTNKQQTNTKQDIYTIEEDTASVYLLSANSELQTEKSNNSEKSKQNEISKQNIKSKQTEKPNPQTQISTKMTNNSYINTNQDNSYINKNKQQTNTNQNIYTIEEDTASVYLLSANSELQTEKANISEKSTHSVKSKQNIKSKQTENPNPQTQVSNKMTNNSYINTNKQQTNTNQDIYTKEEDTASVYLLSANSELQTEKSTHSEKSKQNIKSKQTENPNPQTQISTKMTNNSYVNTSKQQTNTNKDIYAIEEDTASVYLLSANSELQTEKVNNSEKSTHSEKSKPNIKSKQTEKPNPQTQISNKLTNNSYINTNKQQTNTKQDIYTIEEDTASVYLLSANSELQTEKANNSEKSKQNEISKQNIKSKQTEKPNPQTQISTKMTNNSYINTNKDIYAIEEDTASVYMLSANSELQTEKTNNSEKSKQSEILKQNIKSKQTEKPNTQTQISNNMTNNSYINTNKQQTNTKQDIYAIEEDTASVYMLSANSELQTEKTNNSEKSTHSVKSKQNIKSKPSETSKPLISKNANNSHLNTNKQQANTKQDIYAIEEDTASVYLLSANSELQTEKVNNSEKSTHSVKSKQNIKSKQTEKPNPQTQILPKSINRNQQQTNTNQDIYTIEEDTASVYMLSANSELQTEKVNNSEKSIHSVKSKQNIKSKQTEKPNPQTQISTKMTNNSYINTNKQQANTNRDIYAIEEDTASVYLLSANSELQTEKVNNSEKSAHSIKSKQNEISKQNIKSKQTEKPNPRTQILNKVTNNSYINTNKQQTNKNQDIYTKEEDTASVYLLSANSELQTEKANNSEKSTHSVKSKQNEISKQNIKSKQTEKPNPQTQISTKMTNNSYINTNQSIYSKEEDTASVYLLSANSELQTEKVNNSEKSIHSVKSKQNEISKQNIKSKQTEKPNPQTQISTKMTNNSYINKNQDNSYINTNKQQTNTNQNIYTKEEDTASVYMLSANSELQTEKSNHSEKSKQNEISKQTEKPNPQTQISTKMTNNSYINKNQDNSHLNTNKQQTNTNQDIYTKEEDTASVYLLSTNSELQTEKANNSEKSKPNEISRKTPFHNPTPSKPLNDTSPKTPIQKQVKTSGYDRSVFFESPTQPDSNIAKTHPRFRRRIPLTVTLKDIGLEGLDSSTIDKTQAINEEKRKKRKRGRRNIHAKSTGADVDLSSSVYSVQSSSSSPRKKGNEQDSIGKKSRTMNQRSLLDSAHKQKRRQIIKPKCDH